jgi:hypothetical protein
MDEPTRAEVEQEAIRLRAHELSLEHPGLTAEDNWLQAEKEINASLMAKIEMSVFGHA